LLCHAAVFDLAATELDAGAMIEIDLLQDVLKYVLVAEDAGQVAELALLGGKDRLHDQLVERVGAVEEHQEPQEVYLHWLLVDQRVVLIALHRCLLRSCCCWRQLVLARNALKHRGDLLVHFVRDLAAQKVVRQRLSLLVIILLRVHVLGLVPLVQTLLELTYLHQLAQGDKLVNDETVVLALDKLVFRALGWVGVRVHVLCVDCKVVAIEVRKPVQAQLS